MANPKEKKVSLSEVMILRAEVEDADGSRIPLSKEEIRKRLPRPKKGSSSSQKEDIVSDLPFEFDEISESEHNTTPSPKLAEGSEVLINDNQVKSGKLSREFMAQALLEVLSRKGLSVRKAAEVAGVSASVISTIKDQSASIDKSLDVLRALGYEVDCTLKPDTP